jgi:RND family efflux transporter MFP subunit
MKTPNLKKLEQLTRLIPAGLRKKKVAIPVAGSLCFVVVLFLLSASNTESIPTTDVRKGEFLVSIKSSGEIRATNSFTLTTPRMKYGQMQIVYLVPEGTTVKAGDEVVRFATTDVDKTISDKESEVSADQSDVDKAKADKELNDSQLEGDLKSSELAYEQAKLQADKMKFEADVAKKGAEIDLQKSQLSLEQAKRKIESQAVVDKSTMQKLVLKLKQDQRDLTQAKADKDQYTLKSKLSGLVVYETNWSTGRKVASGDSPWGGMPIVSLPDLSAMQSVTNVNEVDVSKVKKGQRVKVKLDAFPDKEFSGTINSVGTIGQQKDNSNIKTFEVIVDIKDTDPVLKPGMTTSNEIIMSAIHDTLFVPLEAVFEANGKPVVYKGSHAQEVTLGERSSNFVIVAKGVKAGEKIALRDPTVQATETISSATEKKQ